jgi:negative regulator of replication initiation
MPNAAKPRRAKAAVGTATPRGRSAAAQPNSAAPPRDAAEFAKQQIERLEAMLQSLIAKADSGELGAIDRILKILDRLDRYQGFSPAARPEESDDDARERILKILSDVDERCAAAEADETTDETPVGV